MLYVGILGAYIDAIQMFPPFNAFKFHSSYSSSYYAPYAITSLEYFLGVRMSTPLVLLYQS